MTIMSAIPAYEAERDAQAVLTYKVRLCPTAAQHRAMDAARHRSQQLFNAALEERIDAYRKARVTRTFFAQCKGLTEVRASGTPFPVTLERWPLKRLDMAFRAFFDRVKKGQTPGFPRFKSLQRWMGFGFTDCQGWKLSGNRLRMQGIGSVRCRAHRQMPSDPVSLVVRRYGKRWFACIGVRVPIAPSHDGPAIGLDMGVTHLATLSNGEHISNANVAKRRAAKVRKSQRALARCRKGSNNRRKVKGQLARLCEREANARTTHLHQVTADLTRRFGTIVIENLAPKNMMRSAAGTLEQPGTNVHAKAGLNRSLADAAFGKFRELLTYKAAKSGGRVVAVNPAYTSQTCAECGAVDRDSRKSQSQFACTVCGHTDNADVNAARVIALRGGGIVPGGLNVGECPKRDRRKVSDPVQGQGYNSPERLIARANAAITSLRHGAETGHCDAAKARRLADTIQRQMNAAHDTHLWPDNVEGTDLWDTLAQWGEWIGMFRRVTEREAV